MKEYSNGRKATEFNKRDLAPIYKAAKNGELKVEKWLMSELYNMADFYGFDDNRSVEDEERAILGMLKAEDKQEAIDHLTESIFNLYSIKKQAGLNRTLVA